MIARYAVLAVAVASLFAAIFWYRGQAISAQADAERLLIERDKIVAINAENAKEIERLTRQAEINNKIMADIHVELQGLNAATAEQARQIADLEGAQPDVKTFLDTPIPDSLKRLYGAK